MNETGKGCLFMDDQSQALALIVDDNPHNLKILASILQQGGLRVAAVSSGYEAVDFIKEKIPDIILLDIMMPGMNGFETCGILKNDPGTADIPVIFISALSDTVDKVKGFEAGGVDYVAKPFEREEVLARVRAHVQLKHSLEMIKRQGRELEQLSGKLEELNSSKDVFFSIIAHDLNAPFNGMIGITKMLMDSLDGFSREELVRVAHDMNASSINLYKLLENLLDWARLQRGLMEFAPAEINIESLAEDCINVLQTAADQKGISVRNNISGSVCAYADYNMIHTVLKNLISNSIKFSNEGGNINVSAVLKDTGFVEVSVADTGVGMDETALGNLFRIDVKQSTEGTSMEKGTGLGLMLCKELVEKNGGRIYAESEPGKGSRFGFEIPVSS